MSVSLTKISRGFVKLSVLLVVASMFAIGNAAPASALSCKAYYNPAEAWFNSHYDLGNSNFSSVASTGTLYTGGSSSQCSDIYVQYVNDGGYQCNYNGYMSGAVQYLSGGVWHTDQWGLVSVPCNSINWVDIGAGYANNTAVRILWFVESFNGQQTTPFPNFSLFL